MTTPSSSPSTASLVGVALNVEGGSAPEWIELIPAGAEFIGRDGRRWTNPDPASVITASSALGRPLPLDWEHATEVRAPKGEPAPAAGWIEALELRDGAIWGRVAWTPRGAAQVAAREYRFVSPGFDFVRATGRITRLVHAGLTNTPNLVLTALNREDRTDATRELKETPLTTLATRLAAVLGLAAAASDDDIVAAATQARAVNRPVDLTTFAPRAELETAVNRANTAETELATLRQTQREADIETALSAALDDGKIIPASAETYRAMCREEGGLERFNALAATLPPIAGAAETRAVNKVERATGAASPLTDEERAVCRVLGQSEADFIKSKEA